MGVESGQKNLNKKKVISREQKNNERSNRRTGPMKEDPVCDLPLLSPQERKKDAYINLLRRKSGRALGKALVGGNPRHTQKPQGPSRTTKAYR